MTGGDRLQASPTAEQIQSFLEEALMTAFCQALRNSGLPTMEVLQLSAMALGGVYRDVAAAHDRGDCPCGWKPAPKADVAALQEALARAHSTRLRPDLARMPVAGRA